MIPRRLLLLCLWVFAIQADVHAEPPTLSGTVVSCGAEQAVILEGSVSGDGRLAAAWTIRPKDKQAAVDWSAYHRDEPLTFVKKYGLNDNLSEDGNDPAKSGYQLVNGVVDLRAHTFTAVASESPYYPDKYRSSLEAAWSPERRGVRYGVLANSVGSNHTDNNVDLQLVQFAPGDVRVTDLKPAADRSVLAFMKRRDPKDHKRYAWRYDFEAIGQHSEATLIPFKGDTLTVHFYAYVFLESNNQDAGFVSFALPKGTVTSIRADDAWRATFRRR